jgi:hypothetical protein
LIPQLFAASAHQIDHIVAEKHGGATVSENLALSCMICNLRKGTDIGSLHPVTNELHPLFHPREMIWSEHFQLVTDEIIGLTAIAETSANFMKFNIPTRVSERAALRRAGFRLIETPNRPR